MKVGSLFSGGGLGDYGLELAGMEIAFQVEIDEYCQKILNLRWPDVPKWKDIKTVKGSELPAVDLISGGFPCQPFSVAGQQRGKDDNRHLWPEMFRVIREVRPRWVLAENVPGIIDIALDSVLTDLEGEGYETGTIVFPTHALGAPHRRDRLWIVAHSNGKRQQKQWSCKPNEEKFSGIKCVSKVMADTTNSGTKGMPERKDSAFENVANSSASRLRELSKKNSTRLDDRSSFRDWWKTEPNVGRVAHGVANRVDRLKLLGNGQVVQVVQWIGEKIMEFESNKEPHERV